MTQSARRTINTRWLLYMVVTGLAALALLMAVMVEAPSVLADPTTVPVVVELQAHNNSVLSIPGNGTASYYADGSWHEITTPNPNNTSMMRVDLAPGTYTFAVTYNGTRDQKTVTIGDSATTVYFHAALVNIELQGYNNAPLSIPGNGSASYYAGGSWHAITDLNPNDNRMVTAEMLPGSYSFALTYNGTRDQKTQTIIEPNPNNHANAEQTVYFHAALVNIELQGFGGGGNGDSNGLPLGGFSASYYAGGQWHQITTPNWNDNRMLVTQMLPGSYTFSITYNGTRDQKTQTIVEPNPNNHANAEQTVYFHAATVDVELLASNGSPLSGGSASYYAGGSWHTIGNTGDTGVAAVYMLPGTYTFAMDYNGTHEQQSATIVEPNPNNGANGLQTVVFQTVNVFVWTEDTSNHILSGGMASYYAGGQWHQITTLDANNHNIVHAQMLPGTYAFADTYNGTRQQKSATIQQNGSDGQGNQSVYFHFDVNS